MHLIGSIAATNISSLGQRRKERLKTLEQAEKERDTTQKEEIERLRRENDSLRRENESLHKEGTSSTSGMGSPVPSPSTKSSALESTAYPRYALTNSELPIEHSGSILSDTGYSSAAPALVGSAPQIIVSPQSLPNVRAYLLTLFQPIFGPGPLIGQQSHLHSLALIAPTLPQSLRPTEIQLSTPHLLVIDLIPSPALRERLISVGDLAAGNFLTQVCTFILDIEDHGQITIWGTDALNELSWEFSRDVLQHWGGWLLGPEWFRRAIFWRTQRGAPIPEGWET